jgi:hypothetical protein
MTAAAQVNHPACGVMYDSQRLTHIHGGHMPSCVFGGQCMGLFMSNAVVPYCDVFKTRRFNKKVHFVYMTQSMGRFSFPQAAYPIDPFELVETDAIWLVA